MQGLHGGVDRLVREKRRTVASAFEERHARHHGIPHERVEREDERLPHQPVYEQAVRAGVDVWVAGVRNDEMQPIRRTRAVEQMMRRAPVAGARLAVRVAQRARDAAFEPRGAP